MDLVEDQDQLKKELQELLDSQLNNNESKEGKSSIKEESELDEPTKGFTSTEIQAFINNQLRKQNQKKILNSSDTASHVEIETSSQSQQQVIGEELEPEGEENISGQHLILVTQNGDKIILIQNSNGALDEEGNSQVDASTLVGAICEENTRGLENTSYYQPSMDMNEQEEFQVQMQHKVRQQMFLMQLEKLREKHKERNLNENNSAINDDQQFSDSNSWNDSDFVKNESSEFKNNRKTDGRKTRSGLAEKNVLHAKWLDPFVQCLDKVFSFAKRRREKLEELGKFFSSASANFAAQKQKLRDEYLKFELNIERFQNTLIKDLNSFEIDLKAFMSDFNLESVLSKIQEEDEKEDQELNDLLKNILGHHSLAIDVKPFHLPIDSNLNNIKLITPSDITITSTLDSEKNTNSFSKSTDSSDYIQDLDPVPEIRDVNYDEPLSETNKDNFECDEIITKEDKKFLIKRSNIKPMVTVKPASIEKVSGFQRSNLVPRCSRSTRIGGGNTNGSRNGPRISKVAKVRRNSKRLTSSSNEETHNLRLHSITRKRYRCKYPECREEFDNNIALMSHLKDHLKETDGLIDDSSDDLEKTGNNWKSMKTLRKISPYGRYQCQIDGCFLTFSSLTHLREHKILDHALSGSVVYKCNVQKCGTAFAKLRYLRKHQRAVHAALKAYRCVSCNINYKHKRSLNKHNYKYHPNLTFLDQPNFLTNSLFEKASSFNLKNLKPLEFENTNDIHLKKKSGLTSQTQRLNLKYFEKKFNVDFDEDFLKKKCLNSKPEIILNPLSRNIINFYSKENEKYLSIDAETDPKLLNQEVLSFKDNLNQSSFEHSSNHCHRPIQSSNHVAFTPLPVIHPLTEVKRFLPEPPPTSFFKPMKTYSKIKPFAEISRIE